MRLSVVVATYDRPRSIVRLVEQLRAQTLDARAFEVIVVDDGSKEDVREALRAIDVPYRLVVERQANAGAASARHRGVELARGDVVLFTDDDMQVAPALLEAHLAVHAEHPHAVVIGCVRNDDEVDMPVFERFHAKQIDHWAERFRDGERPHGGHLFTGNVSMRRADYLEVGGFDRSLGNSEDVELGFRLEKNGVEFVFCDAGYTLHASDHASVDKWLARAHRYGHLDTRIAKKHADLPHANPWRFVSMVNPISRPFLALSLAAPRVSKPIARALMRVATTIDRAGLERLGVMATTLVFGMEYFRGLREELGSRGATMRDYGDFLRRHRGQGGVLGAAVRLVDAVRGDHKSLGDYRNKYVREPAGSLRKDLLEKIGLQIMIGVRVMRFFEEARATTAAKLTSRAMRFFYGSDVHWGADFGEGVAVAHGFGLAISRSAKIGARCILFHNVTLAESMDPTTRIVGAPTLEDDVHVGPGATLIGPITIGAGTKIMAGCVVTQSIPPGSLVEAPKPTITVRAREARPAKMTGTAE